MAKNKEQDSLSLRKQQKQRWRKNCVCLIEVFTIITELVEPDRVKIMQELSSFLLLVTLPKFNYPGWFFYAGCVPKTEGCVCASVCFTISVILKPEKIFFSHVKQRCQPILFPQELLMPRVPENPVVNTNTTDVSFGWLETDTQVCKFWKTW